MSRLLRRRFCTSLGNPEQNPTPTPTPSPRLPAPLPLPHRSLPAPAGQDLDVVAVAHSHLVRGEWSRLDALAAKLTPFRVKHGLLRVRRDPVLSLEFFDWAHLRNPGLLTLETHAIILHILTKAGKFRPADSILRRTVIPGLKGRSLELFDALVHSYRLCDSSPRVFDSLFKAYAHLKKVRDATETFRRMRDYGFLPTVESCNAFLSSLLGLDRGDIVLTFYREMGRCRISPNAYTLNMVMRALCNCGRLEHALKVFDEMGKKEFSPMVSTFNTLIDGYCKKGLLVAAVRLKNAMSSEGLQPNVVTYNTLIHGFCREGKLQDANKIFNEMKAANASPNTVTYNTLISGYSRINNSEMGFRLHEEMVRDGVEVDILTYNALILGLNLVKGRGGSHLREKMVEGASRRLVVVVNETKLVGRIGASGHAVPVEVVPFGWQHTLARLEAALEGCQARLRRSAGGEGKPFVTDNGNFVVDLFFEEGKGIQEELREASDRILRITGVLEHGMFLGMASLVIVAWTDGRVTQMGSLEV